MLRNVMKPCGMLSSGIRTFSTTRSVRDFATCQLLGRLATTPTTFQAKNGSAGVRYVVATNYGSKENPQTNYITVMSFNEDAIETLTKEDLKGVKVLVNGNMEIRSRKQESGGSQADAMYLKQTSLHILEKPKKRQDVPSEQTQQDALEDSFSV